MPPLTQNARAEELYQSVMESSCLDPEPKFPFFSHKLALGWWMISFIHRHMLKWMRSMWPKLNNTQEDLPQGSAPFPIRQWLLWRMQHHPAAGRDQKGKSARQEPEESLTEVHGVVPGKETDVKPVSQQEFFLPYLGCRERIYFCFGHSLFNKLQS